LARAGLGFHPQKPSRVNLQNRRKATNFEVKRTSDAGFYLGYRYPVDLNPSRREAARELVLSQWGMEPEARVPDAPADDVSLSGPLFRGYGHPNFLAKPMPASVR
jgi:hypothetical protein